IRRDAAPAPPPVAATIPAATTPAATVPAGNAPQAADTGGFDLQGVVDRLMGASDAQIAEKLRAILTSKRLEKRVVRPEERKAVESFYAARDYAPLWIKDGRLTGRAKAAVVRLKNAAAEG